MLELLSVSMAGAAGFFHLKLGTRNLEENGAQAAGCGGDGLPECEHMGGAQSTRGPGLEPFSVLEHGR